MKSDLPPIVRSISVSWQPEEAFRRFTADFGNWWPRHTHSIGGKCVERIVFECNPGGLIFEPSGTFVVSAAGGDTLPSSSLGRAAGVPVGAPGLYRGPTTIGKWNS